MSRLRYEPQSLYLVRIFQDIFTYFSETHADGTPVSKTMKNTSEAVLFFDQLFDSVNGSRSGSEPGKMRGPVKEIRGESKHIKFWQESIKTLENVYYIDRNSKKQIPSIRNWITTLKSSINIWQDLKAVGVNFFYTRNLNQDPLENFFGRIRALNSRNINPDATSFKNAFRSLLVTNVMGPHSPHANCEDDMGQFIFETGMLLMNLEGRDSAQVIVSDLPSTSTTAPAGPAVASGATAAVPVASEATAAADSTSQECGRDKTVSTLFCQARKEKIRVHASAFTAGYVSRKLLSKNSCRTCKDSILASDVSNIHDWISARERRGLKGRNLRYPNSQFTSLFQLLIETINSYLESSAQKRFVVGNIRAIFLRCAVVDWLGCQQHHSELLNQFIILVCRLQIHNWCNSINKIIRGVCVEKLSWSLDLTNMQTLALKKYKSRLKK